MFRALGFDTLKEEKEHCYVYCKRRPPKDFSPEVQRYIKFGCENEIHAISTLVGLAMPALLPSCYVFLECGPMFIHGQNCRNLIEVSGDGMLQCKNGENCNQKHPKDRRIAVEAKHLYPSEDFPKFPLYRMPMQHIPQTLCEMAVNNVTELWLLSVTLFSMSIIVVYFDPNLWEKLMDLAEETYGGDKVCVPTKLHHLCKSLKVDLVNFVDTHTRCIGEYPSLCGELVINLPQVYLSPYAEIPNLDENLMDVQDVMESTRIHTEECSLLFRRMHEVMREQACELIMFIISDKDHLQDDLSPTSGPVAYALKGSCLTNRQLWHLIDTVRDECRRREIPILVECYDGQWQITVMTTERGYPLNKLRLAHSTWSRVGKMSKQHLLEEILSTNKVKCGDLDLLMLSNFPEGIHHFQNVVVERNPGGCLHVNSRGGPLMEQSVAGDIKTCPDYKLWLTPDAENKEDIKKKVQKQVGLKSTEKNFLSTLPVQFQNEAMELLDFECDQDDVENEDYLPDINDQQTPLEKLLSSENFKLLHDILEELREVDPVKWEDVTVHDIFPDILRDSKLLFERYHIPELSRTRKVLESYTGRSFYSSQLSKSRNVNIICKAFEGSNFIQENKRIRQTNRNNM